MTEKPTNVRRFFLLHMRPSRLPTATLRYTHTFGLGGMSAVLQFLTDVLRSSTAGTM